jgi:hypothetical protein
MRVPMDSFYVVSVLWMVVVLALMRFLSPRQAVLLALWGGYLFMPRGSDVYPLIGLAFEKSSNTSLALLVGFLLFRRRDLRYFHPAWPDLLYVAAVILPFLSLASNGFEDPGESVRTFGTRLLKWSVPYFLGRIYFADQEGLRQVAVSVVWAGMAFIPLCLFEMLLGPDYYLSRLLFNMGNWGNVERLGGWRPEVFMVNGGLELCSWMALATIMACGLWLLGRQRLWIGPFLALLTTTVLCRGVYGYGLLVLGLVAVWAGRSRHGVLVLALLFVVPPVYIGLRVSGVTDGSTVVGLIQQVHARGAKSLSWRLKTETKLVRVITEKNAILGLSGKKTHHPWPDGLWMHPLVKGGWVGLALWLALFLLVPIGMALRQLYRNPDAENDYLIWLLALMATLSIVSSLHNRIYIMAIGLVLGSLVSYVREQSRLMVEPADAGEDRA